MDVGGLEVKLGFVIDGQKRLQAGRIKDFIEDYWVLCVYSHLFRTADQFLNARFFNRLFDNRFIPHQTIIIFLLPFFLNVRLIFLLNLG